MIPENPYAWFIRRYPHLVGTRLVEPDVVQNGEGYVFQLMRQEGVCFACKANQVECQGNRLILDEEMSLRSGQIWLGTQTCRNDRLRVKRLRELVGKGFSSSVIMETQGLLSLYLHDSSPVPPLDESVKWIDDSSTLLSPTPPTTSQESEETTGGLWGILPFSSSRISNGGVVFPQPSSDSSQGGPNSGVLSPSLQDSRPEPSPTRGYAQFSQVSLQSKSWPEEPQEVPSSLKHARGASPALVQGALHSPDLSPIFLASWVGVCLHMADLNPCLLNAGDSYDFESQEEITELVESSASVVVTHLRMLQPNKSGLFVLRLLDTLLGEDTVVWVVLDQPLEALVPCDPLMEFLLASLRRLPQVSVVCP